MDWLAKNALSVKAEQVHSEYAHANCQSLIYTETLHKRPLHSGKSALEICFHMDCWSFLQVSDFALKKNAHDRIESSYECFFCCTCIVCIAAFNPFQEHKSACWENLTTCLQWLSMTLMLQEHKHFERSKRVSAYWTWFVDFSRSTQFWNPETSWAWMIFLITILR